ncbi:cell division protein PerM [Nocardia pseudobrasiliensis]|uniref:Uncharacterized protein n=1 Tax=Nocardia pseudobrasiliensis TaxID=45979 RepID=A0A370I7D7_9NOCA|nr:DUF6350 family protein [Nocardia pseudobrasiliensis]RDI66646.1 hypothetical protein DFR76_104396 [Nocardia pseudobrasiliensis]
MRSSLVRWDDSGQRRVDAPEHDSEPNRPEDNIFLSLTPERAKVLLIVAARTSSYTVVVLVALVLATLFAAGSGMTGAPGAIAAGWLAVHQVPLVIGTTSLGLLPLLPTGLVVWFAAGDCARAVEPRSSHADLGWIVGAALSGPLLITAVCLAVAEDASSVVALQPPNTLAAFGCVGGLHLLAAGAGILRSRPELVTPYLPEWVLPGARVAVRALGRLLLAGAALTLLSFLVHWSQIGETYRAAGNFAGVLGLTALSLAYLPNVVIGAASVLMGADVHLGAGSLNLFSVVGARLPGLPVLVAVPAGPAALWWPVVLLIPAAVGVLAGVDCAREAGDRPRTPWATLTAAGLTAVAALVLGSAAGGAAGSFGELGPGVWLFAGLTLVWMIGAGYVGLLAAHWFLVAPAPAAADYYDDEYADYADEEEYSDEECVADDYGDEYPEAHYGYEDYASDSDAPIVDGELIEEPLALSTIADEAKTAENSDILDAEVVEADLPNSNEVDGR